MVKKRMVFGNLVRQNLVEMHRGRILKTKDLFMLLRGEVEYNADPLMLGRLKVRVAQIHGVRGEKGSVETKDLQWAFMLFPRSLKDSGSFIIPKVGEKVWVLFEAGNTDNIVVLGSWFAVPDEEKELLNPSIDIEVEKIDMVGRGELKDRVCWNVSRGTELIRECWDIRNLNPSRVVIHKGIKGAMFLIDERDEEEAVYIVDRLGQALVFEGEVSEEDNLGNTATRYQIERGKKVVVPLMKQIRLFTGSKEIKLNSIAGEEGIKLETENYRIVIDEEANCIRIMKKWGLAEIIINSEGELEVVGNIIFKGNAKFFGDIDVYGKAHLQDVVTSNQVILGEEDGDKRFSR